MNIETIARVCHEANRAICRDAGHPEMPAWDDAPQWQRDSCIDGVRFYLANPDAGPSASHEQWMRHKAAHGWVYGPEKDADKKTHPCMVPWEDLPDDQRIKDDVFRGIVHAMRGYIELPLSLCHKYEGRRASIQCLGKFPIDEPPYVGTPLDSDWPGYHNHWTPLSVPPQRDEQGNEVKEQA